MPKQNVIYVASIGRSGSTLLESMLGAHSAIETVGEAHIWPHEERSDIRPCSCGELMSSCPFWRAVADEVPLAEMMGPGIDFFREHHNAGRTLRPRLLRQMSPAWRASADAHAEINAYAANNARLFEAFSHQMREQCGRAPEWIVDASKDPYRLLWFARSGMFNLKVVHVTKDPVAFSYSVTRTEIEAGQRAKSIYLGARQTGAWVAQNALVSRIATNVLQPADYMHLRYEDFATDPHAAFEQVCSFVGVAYESDAVRNFRSGNMHTVAGNPMRYESRPIELDERWRDRLPAANKWVAAALSVPVKRRMGY
ncbi:sulfotransferase [Demequina mangrovi]|uniref:Sulfotransferase family protein n=1 Tax=Demequina mangrovi TaxID=1043493 RepID=A0A1H6YSA5_9MICO|nr:sulfotransferase [Demequina mangrovi]SEJ40200.1 Sulfotransferase family protein [Demequina mangrovi]